ncbi:MAG: hypothetical protein R3B70_07495 [Polyangiaceae bacterium]
MWGSGSGRGRSAAGGVLLASKLTGAKEESKTVRELTRVLVGPGGVAIHGQW